MENTTSTGDIEKLWHIPRNLEACTHVQGCAYAWEGLNFSLLGVIEPLQKQEVKAKAEL